MYSSIPSSSIVNDAFVGGFLLSSSIISGDTGLKMDSLMVFRKIVQDYLMDGSYKCCFINGEGIEKIYARDSLAPGYLVWAGIILDDKSLVDYGKRLMNHLVAWNYEKGGRFIDNENLGTNSEAGLSLIEIYEATGEVMYLEIAKAVYINWLQRTEGASSVDLAEFIIFLRRLNRHIKIDDSIIEVLKDKLRGCIAENGLFPLSCKEGKNPIYFPVVSAIAYEALF